MVSPFTNARTILIDLQTKRFSMIMALMSRGMPFLPGLPEPETREHTSDPLLAAAEMTALFLHSSSLGSLLFFAQWMQPTASTE